MPFDAKEFEERLRTAHAALEDACDLLEKDPPAYEGGTHPHYLLGRLHNALEIIEYQLPEFEQVAEIVGLEVLAGETK